MDPTTLVGYERDPRSIAKRGEAFPIERQLVEIRGTWSLKGQILTVDWQPSKMFHENKMVLEIVEDEYGDRILKGERQTLYNHYY